MLRETTEEKEIANLFRNPSRRSQPLQNITSSTFGKESAPVDDSMTPGDMFGASIDPYGGGYYDPYGSGSYDPYGGGGYYDPYGGGGSYGDYDPYGGYDPYGSGMSGSPAPWYTDRGLPIYSYPSEGGMYGDRGIPIPSEGGMYGSYDPYAAEDARLSSLAAGMPDVKAPSFGSSGVPSSDKGDYYKSPEWLRRLSTVGGPMGPYPGAIPDNW